MRPSKVKDSPSVFVLKENGKYRCVCRLVPPNGPRIFFGTYTTEEEAEEAKREFVKSGYDFEKFKTSDIYRRRITRHLNQVEHGDTYEEAIEIIKRMNQGDEKAKNELVESAFGKDVIENTKRRIIANNELPKIWGETLREQAEVLKQEIAIALCNINATDKVAESKDYSELKLRLVNPLAKQLARQIEALLNKTDKNETENMSYEEMEKIPSENKTRNHLNKTLSEQLEELMENSLRENEKTCIRHYYLENMTYEEIAKKYNVSKERIRQKIAVALMKLKRKALVNPESYKFFLKNMNQSRDVIDSKKKLIGQVLRDSSVVLDYDINGILIKDKYGVEKYIKDEELDFTQEEYEAVVEKIFELRKEAEEAKIKANSVAAEFFSTYFGEDFMAGANYINAWAKRPENKEYRDKIDQTQQYFKRSDEILEVLDPNDDHDVNLHEMVENKEQAELAYEFYEDMIKYHELHFELYTALIKDAEENGVNVQNMAS